jgi:hypothetical protein
MSDTRARLYVLVLLAIAVAVCTLLIVDRPAAGYDGPTPRRSDRDVDVWVWTAEEQRQAAEARAVAQRAAEQRQLTTPPPAPRNSVWDALAQCESGGNWSINTGNGYYGGLQFALTSWRAVGGTGYPHQHSREEQINRGIKLQAIQGWGAWPACSSKLGLR